MERGPQLVSWACFIPLHLGSSEISDQVSRAARLDGKPLCHEKMIHCASPWGQTPDLGRASSATSLEPLNLCRLPVVRLRDPMLWIVDESYPTDSLQPLIADVS